MFFIHALQADTLSNASISPSSSVNSFIPHSESIQSLSSKVYSKYHLVSNQFEIFDFMMETKSFMYSAHKKKLLLEDLCSRAAVGGLVNWNHPFSYVFIGSLKTSVLSTSIIFHTSNLGLHWISGIFDIRYPAGYPVSFESGRMNEETFFRIFSLSIK